MSACKCGCGGESEATNFIPGHDQKLRIKLEERVGGILNLKELVDYAEEYAKGNLSQENLGMAVRKLLYLKQVDTQK